VPDGRWACQIQNKKNKVIITSYVLDVKVKDHLRGTTRAEPDRDSLRRKAMTLASILATIALVVGSFFGDRGILHLLEVRERAQDLQHAIEALGAENAGLVDEILELRTSTTPIERLAREKLDMAEADEMVFILRPDPPARP